MISASCSPSKSLSETAIPSSVSNHVGGTFNLWIAGQTIPPLSMPMGSVTSTVLLMKRNLMPNVEDASPSASVISMAPSSKMAHVTPAWIIVLDAILQPLVRSVAKAMIIS